MYNGKHINTKYNEWPGGDDKIGTSEKSHNSCSNKFTYLLIYYINVFKKL